MIRRIVSFPRDRFSRADAWFWLDAQQFPGAPRVLKYTKHADVWCTAWRKSHTGGYWRWYHDICDHSAESCRACARCQDEAIASPDWLGLREGFHEPLTNFRGLGPFDGGSEW